MLEGSRLLDPNIKLEIGIGDLLGLNRRQPGRRSYIECKFNDLRTC